MTDRKMVRTWAEVDLDALEHNYHLLRGLAPQAKFLGLVKANAYGHGAVPIAKKLQALGADMLAVACLDEAVELRQAGITIPILCLGQTRWSWPASCWRTMSPRRWATWRREKPSLTPPLRPERC